MKRVWFHITAGLGIGVLLLLSGLFWLEATRRFPLPAPGDYVGVLEGVLGSGAGSRVPIFVERRSLTSPLLVSIFQDGWSPELVDVLVRKDSSGEWTTPLFLKENEIKLRFIGARAEGKGYLGTVYDVTNNREGKWRIAPLKSHGEMDSQQSEKWQEWLFAFSERAEVRAKLDGARLRVKEQQDEINRLTEVITESRELQDDGAQKFERSRARLKAAETDLSKKREEAAQFEKRLAMAYRVTQMGKLVTLARESLHRENRWIDSLLKTANKDITPELQDRYRRGLEILELQDHIALERQRMNALQDREGAR